MLQRSPEEVWVARHRRIVLRRFQSTLGGRNGGHRRCRNMDWNFEIQAAFTNLPSWKLWLDEHPWLVDPQYVASMVAAIRQKGLVDPLQGPASPSEITIDERNLRESIVFRGINSRCRAILKVLVNADLSNRSV